MSTTSPNLGLTLAGYSDTVDVVGQIANNFTIIDGITINGVKIAPSMTLTIAQIGGGTITGNLAVTGTLTALNQVNSMSGNDLHLNAGSSNRSVYLDVNGSTIITISGSAADIYTNAWADYSGTSTIVGWTSISGKYIYTKKVGKTVFVQFYISGTSNSTSTSFTLPYEINANLAPAFLYSAIDNGGNAVAAFTFASTSSSVMPFYKDMGEDAWTNSGTKTIYGQFWYQSS